MHDHRAALIQIMEICGLSQSYTRRTQHINDVAMRALGMTSNQRCAVHGEIIKRTAGTDAYAGYLARCAKRDAHLLEKFGQGCEPTTY